jgi:four helix bundle protein
MFRRFMPKILFSPARFTHSRCKSSEVGPELTTSQLRRAAVSVACNIVEGCARRGTSEYLNFLNIAAGSASETRYLVEVSCRLGFLSREDGQTVTGTYTELCARLQALISSLSHEP